jgi:Tfp pilus assembly PilM family ATPase
MPARERLQAATFEAARGIDFPIAEAAVSLVPDQHGDRWLLAIARRSAIATAIRIARRARLRPIAVDDTAFALRRALPHADGVVDVGTEATSLVIFRGATPSVQHIATGGSHFRAAIAAGLGIDLESAERRKCLHGFSGAGTACRDEWLAAVATGITKARNTGRVDIRTLLLCGNGSRVPDLADALARASGCAVAHAAFPSETSDIVPADVLRAAAPDWSLAYGLALWNERL